MHLCPKGHQSQAGDYCDECGTPIAGSTRSATPDAGAGQPASSTPTAAATPAGPPCPQCGSPAAGRFCEVCGYDFLMAKLSPAMAPTPNAQSPSGPPTNADPDATQSTPAAAQSVPAQSATGQSVPAPAHARPDVAALPDGSPTTSSTLAAEMPGAATPGSGEWRLVVTADRDYHARMQAQAEPDVEPITFPAFFPERRFPLTGTQVLIGRRSRTRGIEPDVDLSGPPADPAVSHAHAMLIAHADGGWTVVDLESANGTFVGDDADPIDANVPVPITDGEPLYVGAWTRLTLRRG